MINSNHFAQLNELRAQPARSLLQRLFADLIALVGEEYRLVRTELTQKRGSIVRALWSSAFSAVFGIVALVCLTVAGVAALSVSIGLPLAALAFGVAYAIVAVALAVAFRRMFAADGDLGMPHAKARLFPARHESPKTLQEQEADIEWTRRRVSETLSGLRRKSDLAQPLRDVAFGVGGLAVAVTNIAREPSTNTR